MNTTRAQHLDWLSLVDVDGQFLSISALRKAFPAGLDVVPKNIRAEARERLKELHAKPSAQARALWIDWLFREALEWGDRYRLGDDVARPYELPEYRTSVRAAGGLIDPRDGSMRAIILHVPYGAQFDERLRDEPWNASPIERATVLARTNGVPIALIEDGERVAIVNVPKEGSTGYAVWQSALFGEGAERTLFASFVSLLHARRFFNVVVEHELAALFAASVIEGAELTKTLGFQVRRAVELFVAALSSVDRDDRRRLGRGVLDDVPPHDVYVAASTVMMRAIFLLFAEERGLLPLDDPLYAESYALSTLREQIESERRESGDEPLERRCTAWRRMLAIFSAIYEGVEHDRLRMPAYGGRLFDQRRFPFLADARIDDLTISTILSALQILEPERGAAARRLSFRELDVEQIGHVYEGLLDHDVRRAEGVVLGFTGKSGDEPEIDLAEIESAAAISRDALIALLAERTGRKELAIAKDLNRGEALARDREIETVRRMRRACENDVALADRLLTYALFLRDDLHGVPTIYLPGALLVRKTRARRDSGTEYTPKVLAEEIVRFTLEPLCYSPGPVDGADRCSWQVKPSADLLALKICDPACGSGAFLVATCRYLADRIVEAWAMEGRIGDDDPTREAQRLAAQRCVYGVDRDGMAVEMAKLSLWLLTFAKSRPFSFLDHAIREGDSLLGITSLDQLLFLHRDPSYGRQLHSGTLFDVIPQVKQLVDEATNLRRELEQRVLIDIRDVAEQERLAAIAATNTSIARSLMDALVGIELVFADRPSHERDAAISKLGAEAHSALKASEPSAERTAKMTSIVAEAKRRLNAGRPPDVAIREPLHWPLEFPEVFNRAHAGFDAIVGNPPFLGGQFITGRFGTDYRTMLLESIAEGRKGSADLVAYFVLRSAQVSNRFGLIATNTIGQGDTREVALDALLSNDWRIVRAEKTRPWPGTAALQVAEIWCARESGRERSVLGDQLVPGISPLLVPTSRVSGTPYRLRKNMETAFQGSVVLGMGFTMMPDQAELWFNRDLHNKTVIVPYLNADDACNDPQTSATRFIINFYDWSEARAREYAVFEVVVEHVRPQRQRRKADGSFALRKPLPERWWQYAEKRPGLYRKIAELRNVVIMPLHSKYAVSLMVPTGQVFSHGLAVFASDDFSLYGHLTSEIHRLWARSRGSTLETRFRYTPTDCFETFALPAESESIKGIMHRLHEHRATLMINRQEGITTTYNRYHDSSCSDDDISRLRTLHIELDLAVLGAYSWADLDLEHDFRATDEGQRFTIDDSVRVELLERLLELNHARYANEEAAGLHGSTKNGKRNASRNVSPSGAELRLL